MSVFLLVVCIAVFSVFLNFIFVFLLRIIIFLFLFQLKVFVQSCSSYIIRNRISIAVINIGPRNDYRNSHFRIISRCIRDKSRVICCFTRL